ncbi:regulator of G-protein signaling 22-like [Anneissia japonica]|uniref:regulator of G-protein signaling 22-like n=1 Tax=Anneissia japonica TaxID=1529436 RepID=UPI0014255B38|nr:regulator of G-protein signaling 22-like [Anneissia japonica]
MLFRPYICCDVEINMPEKKLSVAPPKVTVEDLEEFLATDNLFIEYFNAFLRLPTFPEPLVFNKDRGGFEVVTDAKQELKSQMQAAVRSKQSPNQMYQVTKQVISEKNPPKVKYAGDSDGDEEPDIKTTFQVQCLNKEQGIQWIKEERVPAFLQSDLYLEYRLAKLISQAEIAAKEEKPLNLIIDSSYKPFGIEKPSVTTKPVYVDKKALTFRDMFICLGETHPTQTDDWYNDVKLVTDTQTTSSTIIRPSAIEEKSSSSRPTSARPPSVLSSKDVVSTIDSGVWSPRRQDSFSIPPHSQTFSFDGDVISNNKLFDNPPKLRSPSPTQWRPPIGDQCCVVLESEKRNYVGAVHLKVVKQNTENEGADDASSEGGESGVDCEKADSEKADNEGSINSEDGKNDGEMGNSQIKTITVDNVDQLAMVTVTHAIKCALRLVTSCSEEEINNYLDENVLKLKTVRSVDLEEGSLNNIVIRATSAESIDLLTVPKQTLQVGSTLSTTSSMKDSIEEDSLIDSDEEEDDDAIFPRAKTYDLSNKKGIDAFKNFLCGNMGEKYWSLWLDLDRANNILEEDNQNQFIGQLREKYVNSGSLCELSREVQQKLGFSQSHKWQSFAELQKIQPKVAEPLLLYWAPRFLMREHYKCNPTKNYLYHRQQLNRPKSIPNPEPKAVTLLPLRPKTCMPKMKKDTVPQFKSALPKEVSTATINNSTFPNLSLSNNLQGLMPKPSSRQKSGPESQQEDLKEQKVLPPGSKKPQAGRVNSARTRPTLKHSESELGRPASAQPVLRKDHIKRTMSESRLHTRSISEESGTNQTKNLSSVLPRPVSRPSSAVSSKASEESDFLGGRRMEDLLDGLMFEKKAGGFFMTYLEQLGNKVLINCLHCWHDIQEYHTLFFSETFSEYVLNRKAQAIFGKHIVPGAYYNIGCSKAIQTQIHREISPPFEELFDGAEEHILQMLTKPFSEMKNSDQRLYDKIEMTQEERRVESKESRYLRRLQRRTMFKERISTPDIGPEDDATKHAAYYQSLRDKVPKEFKDFDFNKLIHNRLELEHFRHFLEDNYGVTDLLCWMDIESFRRTPHIDNLRRDKKAKDIKIRYLNKKYFFGPNSPATRQQQHQVMQAGGGWGKILLDRPPTQILIEAQKYVRERLEQKWLPMYLATDGFYERMKPLLKIDEVVDDLLLAKKKRSMAIYKLLEGKWASSSREIIAFRHALLNPVTCRQLCKFVSVRGDNLENDILFWLEVQKFKEMYHNHTEESLIHQKFQTILACFIDSEMPPSLQIDITPEQAERLLEKRPREMGPYVFRETQLTVFRVLYPHWNEFLKYKNTVAEEKLLYELEKKKKRQLKKEMEKKRIQQDKEFARKGYVSEYEDDRNSNASATQTSKSLTEFFEDDFDDSIEKVEWKYSHYVTAIEDEQVRLNGDERASSILSDQLKTSKYKSYSPKPTRQVKKQVRLQENHRPSSRVGSAKQRSKLGH